MVRTLIAIALVSKGVFGQVDFSEYRPLSTSLTISPAWMLNRDQNNTYLSGFAELHTSRNTSFRGDVYLYIDGNGDAPFLRSAVRSYFGANYNFWRGNACSSLGFQPGVTIMEPARFGESGESYGPQFSPSFALSAGMTYYIWTYFHVYANLTYVRSKISGIPGALFQTDELIFSAGLGFQIPTKKPGITHEI